MPDSPVTPSILVADDQADVLDALRLVLKVSGFDTESANSIAMVRERLVAKRYDLLLMDLNYGRDTTSGREGLELLTEVLARDPFLPVIVMTGWGTIETAVEAMRRGARTLYTNRGTTRSSCAPFVAKSTTDTRDAVPAPSPRERGRTRG